MIERPEDRQPTVRVGRPKAGEVRGVDHEHGVKFEANGSRLDVAHTGEQQGGEQIAIAQAAFYSRGNFFQQPLARGVFEEADEWFNFGIESDDVRFQFGFGG